MKGRSIMSSSNATPENNSAVAIDKSHIDAEAAGKENGYHYNRPPPLN
jgi:hypothetical protein